jgi:membrane-bound lytic murein transglycosylase D
MKELLKSMTAWTVSLLSLVVVMSGCATNPETTLPEYPPNPDYTALPSGRLAAAGAARSAPASPPSPANEIVPPPVVIDPLRPEVKIDPSDVKAHMDLWQRVRRGFAIPDLETDLVRVSEQWYANRPDYVARMTERSSRYLFHVIEEVERRGMPTELALLPFVESAFNPQAMSVAKASGMWQFIPSTGKDYQLKQNVFRDDRRGVIDSTRAALDYLEKLYGMFGDWHLALAAYNWGERNVQRAIARNEKAGLPTDYVNLRMPDETRNYVPKLQAVENIIARPQAFSLALPAVENHPYFLTVAIQRDIDVDLAAKFAGIPLAEFKKLNPQMNRPVILAAGTPQLLLPYDDANRFVRSFAAHRGAYSSWTAWTVPQTMRPATAAQQVGMSESELRAVNGIPLKMLVRAGSTLLVSRPPEKTQDVPEHVADHGMMQLAPEAPPLRRVAFKAGKRGTTVAAVARRYKVSDSQVAGWNEVAVHSSFQPGQTVVVFVPTRGKAVHRTASRNGRSAHAGSVRKTVTRTPRARGVKTRT